MPLPTPRDNEKRDEFLHRCMGDEVMVGDYTDEKQRSAVCNKQWEKAPHSASASWGSPNIDKEGGREVTIMAEQLIPIFKTGTHTDSQGRTREWGTADLDKIVASYDPAEHEAPIVIGHPKDNAPAFGWAAGLERKGEVLFAKAKQLVPEFVDMVRQGLFKKRSISLYPDGSLRHIGFLGAQPPAVKGLADVAFAAGEEDTVIEFASTDDAEASQQHDSKKKMQGGTNMSLRDKIKARFTKAIDDIPEEELAIEPAMFSEAEVKRQVAEATKKAKDEGVAEGKKAVAAEFSEQRKALKKTELDGYVNGLIAGDGKKGRALVAAKKAGLVEFMATLSDEEETIEFTEGEGDKAKAVKKSPLAAMKAILETLPADITYSEVATKDKDAGDTGNAGEKLSTLARGKQDKAREGGKEISFRDAFDAVQLENTELAQEYLSELQGRG